MTKRTTKIKLDKIGIDGGYYSVIMLPSPIQRYFAK